MKTYEGVAIILLIVALICAGLLLLQAYIDRMPTTITLSGEEEIYYPSTVEVVWSSLAMMGVFLIVLAGSLIVGLLAESRWWPKKEVKL